MTPAAPSTAPFALPRYVRALAGLGLLGLALSVLNGTVGLGETFTGRVYPLAFLPAAVLCFLRARVVPAERVPWAAFGASFLLWAASLAYYGTFVGRSGTAPFPSIGDALWFGTFPMLYVGLITLVQARALEFRRSVWLDGLVGALAIGALGATVLVGPIFAATGGDVLASAVTLAYPAGDLTLLVLALTVGALMGWRPGRDWLLIALALAVAVGADLTYVHQSVTGGWALGSLLDSAWVLASLLVAWAAWHRPSVQRRVDLDAWNLLIVPSAFTVLALAILLLGNIDSFDGAIGQTAGILAAAALVASLMRAALTFREKRRLGVVANLDPLTGLLHHGAFHAALDRELAAVAHTGSEEPFSVVMFDLDGFKDVNDLRGHAEGDRVLRGVAEVIRVIPRSSDATGRLGGDEFAMLLRGLDGRQAATVAERFRDALRQRDLGVDVSYGIGEWPVDGPSKAMILLRADTALYAVKAERNGTRRAQEVPGSDEHRQRSNSWAEVHERERDLDRAQLRAYAEDVRNSYARELHRTRELKASYLATVKTLAAAVEAKDEYTGGHIQRVHALGALLAKEMLPGEGHNAELSYGFLLHDVGKLAVPDAVLNKPGKLTEDEWRLMKLHPEQGAAILSTVPFLGKALEVVRHHHERWDGTGYPDQLRGEEIPLWARIFAIVDTIDAITSDRPYRGAQSLDAATAQLDKGVGSQFDPACVEAFKRLDRTELETLLQHRPADLPAIADLALPDSRMEASA